MSCRTASQDKAGPTFNDRAYVPQRLDITFYNASFARAYTVRKI